MGGCWSGEGGGGERKGVAIVTILRYLAARPQDSEGAKIPLRPSAYCAASIPSRTPLSLPFSLSLSLSHSLILCLSLRHSLPSLLASPPVRALTTLSNVSWCILIRTRLSPREQVWMLVSVSIPGDHPESCQALRGPPGQRFRIRGDPWIRIVKIPARRIVLRDPYSTGLSANSSRRGDDYGAQRCTWLLYIRR